MRNPPDGCAGLSGGPVSRELTTAVLCWSSVEIISKPSAPRNSKSCKETGANVISSGTHPAGRYRDTSPTDQLHWWWSLRTQNLFSLIKKSHLKFIQTFYECFIKRWHKLSICLVDKLLKWLNWIVCPAKQNSLNFLYKYITSDKYINIPWAEQAKVIWTLLDMKKQNRRELPRGAPRPIQTKIHHTVNM